MTEQQTRPAPPTPLLDVVVYERDNGSEMPLREFLATLLVELWNEEEGFDPKRPLGQSMWWTTVVERLEAAGYEDADEEVKRAIRVAFERKQS